MIVRCHCKPHWFAANVGRTARGSLHIRCPYCQNLYVQRKGEDSFTFDGTKIYCHSSTDVYVVVIHQPQQNFYTLNRGYGLNQQTEIRYSDILKQCIRFAIERADHHKQASFDEPIWSKGLPNDEFTSFWLY